MSEDQRLGSLVECLFAYSRLDFSERVPVSDRLDYVDAVACGVNIMVDELERKVVSRKDLEDAYTRLRETQAQLVHASKLSAIGQLTACVAHEVNNPLGWSAGALSMARRRAAQLRRELDATPSSGANNGGDQNLVTILTELTESLELAAEGVARIRGVIADLTVLTRGRGSAIELILVDDVVSATCNLFRSTVEDRARLSLELGAPQAVRGNRGRVGQVVTNLLVNALQALKEWEKDCAIRVATRGDDERVHIVVDDSGPGVPLELRRRIFEPFFTTRSDGMGLGLSLVYDIVASMGGELHVGEAPLGGARFEVSLPAVLDDGEGADVRTG